MNFLQLCQRVADISGTVAGVPSFTTVAGAAGRIKQVVGWTRDAYTDIQNERPDWLWMRGSFTATLTIGVSAYSPASLGLTRVAHFLPDLPAEGWRNLSIYETGLQKDEGSITQIPFSTFRERYQRGVHDRNKPSEWAVSPAGELLVGPTPDKAYVVSGEYRKTPQELLLDADVPEMPAAFHGLIVAEAIRIMARADEAFQVLVTQGQQYERLRNPLVLQQTPPLTFGGGTLA